MNVVLLSVVIPCYNAADTLVRAIQSVLAQAMYGVEILIVDDKSSDNSSEVARGLSADYPNIHLISHGVNAGPAYARNTGLCHAKGRYVCFLDSDDEYAPNFFNTVVPILEKHSDLGWVSTGIELVNCNRIVHPVQLAAVVSSMPSNLIVRTAAVSLLGGFAEHSGFRGRVGGEDIMFRLDLEKYFLGTHRPEKFLRHWIKPGSHFEYFMYRSYVVDGQIAFKFRSPEEESGELAKTQKAQKAYSRNRMEALASLRNPELILPQLSPLVFQSVTEFEKLRRSFEDVQGFLDPLEGYTLYHLAKKGPSRGAIVEIGSLFGRSTCWLAAGACDAKRDKVVAVDHFLGSPEHQSDGSAPISELANGGSTYPKFIANLQRFNLREWVDVRVGNSLQIAAAWQLPIRLLFIDGDHSYEASKADADAWCKFVAVGGLVAFHDVGVFQGVTDCFGELRSDDTHWKLVSRTGSIGVLQRL